MKVLLASHGSALDGGSEQSLLEVASYLAAKRSVEVTVAVPGVGPLGHALDERNVNSVVLPYEWAASNRDLGADVHGLLACLQPIREFMSAYSPDVVMTNTSVIPWFGYLAHVLGVPHAWFLREDVTADIGIDYYPDRAKTLATIGQFADVVFVNSHYMKERYETALARSDIEVIYPTISRRILSYVEESPAQPFGNEPLRAIVYGPILPAKNQLEVLEAAKLLRDSGVELELTIMGVTFNRDYYTSLRDFVEANHLTSTVHFLEHQDDPFPIVNQHHVCVVPSFAEAFGRVAVEAMLLKKVVIATDSGGNRETVGAAPGGGLLYPLGRPDVLAGHLRSLAAGPAAIRKLGEAAHEFAMAQFIETDHLAPLHASLKKLARSVKPAADDWITSLAVEANLTHAERLQQLRTELDEKSTEQAARDHELENIKELAAERAARLEDREREAQRLAEALGARTQQLAVLENEVKRLADLQAATAPELKRRQREVERLTRLGSAQVEALADRQRDVERLTKLGSAQVEALADRQREVERLTELRNTRSAELERALVALSDVAEELARTRSGLVGAYHAITGLRNELATTKQVAQELLDSTTWRATAPLRAAGRTARRLTRNDRV